MSAYESVKCPECNGEMVSRRGKYGVFYLIYHHPNCKGTRDNQGRSKQDRDLARIESDDTMSEWTSNERDKIRWNKKGDE